MTDKELYNKMQSEINPDELLLERTKSAMKSYKKASVMRYAAVAAAFVFVVAAVLVIPKITGQTAAGVSSNETASNDMTDSLLGEFIFNGGYYHSLGKTASEGIGEPLGTVSDSADSSLIGKEVYEYTRCCGRAIIAVSDGSGGYGLYRYAASAEYLNNGEVDASEYVDIYGFDGGTEKIVIYYDFQNTESGQKYSHITVTDPDTLSRFIAEFSALKSDAAGYFSALESYSDPQTASYAVSYAGSYGEDGGFTPAYDGNNALGDSIMIELYNRDGLNYFFDYYPNINCFGRFAATDGMVQLVYDLIGIAR